MNLKIYEYENKKIKKVISEKEKNYIIKSITN